MFHCPGVPVALGSIFFNPEAQLGNYRGIDFSPNKNIVRIEKVLPVCVVFDMYMSLGSAGGGYS